MNEYPPQDNQPPQQPYPQQPYPQQQPPTQYPPNYPPGYQPPYPPNAPPPPAPPAKKKRGPLFWVLVVVGALIVCGVIGNAISHSSSATTSTAPTTSTTQAVQATGTPVPTATQAPTQAPSQAKVGDTITLNDVDATLTKVKVGPVDQYSTPKSGYEFVTVHVKLKNHSGVEQDYNQFNFHIKSGTGNITDVDAATYGEGINDLGDGKLSDGGTAEGNIVFQVKKGDHKAMLTWQPNIFNGNAGDNGWNLGL